MKLPQPIEPTLPYEDSKQRIRTLLVDTDVAYAERLGSDLECTNGTRHVLNRVGSLPEAQYWIKTHPTDAVLIDLATSEQRGLPAFLRLYEAAPHLPVVILTNLDDKDLAARVIDMGAQDYLIKDHVNADVIARVLRYAVGRKRVEDELRQSREQLRQVQKMEGIGRLAGGIAHDFNNLLTSIMGFASLLQQSLPEDDPAADDAAEIIAAGERATTLTRQLLTFSRHDIPQIRRIDLNEVTRNMDHILRRTIGEDIELVTLLGEDLPAVVADANQLEQVLMNLCVNARDAMPRGGKLTLETEMLYLDEAFCSSRIGLRPGSHVHLSVTDDGVGMTEEVSQHAFDPFFTTKPKDHGTGLGLSSVYGIVIQQEGHIEINSTPGRGTTIHIYIPSVEGAAEATTDGKKGFVPTGEETILIVEDEGTLRRLAGRILKELGYTIVEARNGVNGLEAFATANRGIDLVLTDVVMPQMGGPEMIDHLRKTGDGFKVLYMTGFADERIMESGLSDRTLRILKKPYDRGQLARSVRRALDAA